MKRNKQAVSLITLVITIIIMIILAGIIILTLSDTNIFNKSNDAVDSHNVKEEITYIQSKIAFYALEKDKTFYEFIKQEFGENNVKDNLDDTYTITLESGNSYIVWENGKVQSSKGIYVEATGFPLMLKDGETVTGTLKATLVDISGEITWSNENDSIATISGTTGESITVTAVSQGKTKVTATCNGYTREYVVKVSAEVPLGAYVEYGVEYIDFIDYTRTYTSINGWRYMGTDENGNKLLISTGVPLILAYTAEANEASLKWWDEDETLNPNERAVKGMLNNFEDIPYYMLVTTYFSPVHGGKAIGKFEGVNINENIENTTTLGDWFVAAEHVDLIKKIRTLTFEELKAICGVENIDIGSGIQCEAAINLQGDARGLFDLLHLEYGNYSYWLATADTNNETNILALAVNSSCLNPTIYSRSLEGCGLRPVIVLDNDVELVFDEDRNLYTIQAE